MRRSNQISNIESFSTPSAPSPFWTVSIFLTALLVSITLAFCQGKLTTEKAMMMGYVEDFFSNNARDITMRKSLEWGDVKTDDKGNRTIRYKFEALIWDKDRTIFCSNFTFDKDGNYVSMVHVEGFPKPVEKPDVTTLEGVKKLVEKFFNQNFRDITARKTVQWGELEKHEDGSVSLVYRYEATIWNKDVILDERRFTFDKNGEVESWDRTEGFPKSVKADGGFVTGGDPGVSGFTHIVVFRPTGEFNPQNPGQFLGFFREKLFAEGIKAGYFRTKAVEGKLVGSFCTGDPEGFERFFKSIPEIEFVRSERLTKESFEAYEKTRQESIPNFRLLEIEKSDWYAKLNERQKKYVQWDENQFAYAYDSKNYQVGNDKDTFEKRWLEELAKPEPGYPGGTLSRYDEAIIGLATIKSGEALKPLLKIAAERVVKDNAHRHYATKALGILGDPAAIPELIPLVYHFNFNTRWDAQVSLVRLTGQNFGSDAKAWGEWYTANRDKLGKDLPKFDPTPVDWSCGDSNREIQRYCDPAVQEESDNRFFGKQ